MFVAITKAKSKARWVKGVFKEKRLKNMTKRKHSHKTQSKNKVQNKPKASKKINE